MSSASSELEAALVVFFEDSRDWIQSSRSTTASSFVTRQGTADALANLDSASRADEAALRAALANGYLVRESDEHRSRRRAGRALDSGTLSGTGVAGLLESGDFFDDGVLASEMAGYLAGPPVPISDWVIVGVDVRLTDDVPVGGWSLATPSRSEFETTLGLPSAWRYSRDRRHLDPELYSTVAVLRREDSEYSAQSGLLLHFGSQRRRAHDLWEPMLVLSLFQNTVVHVWAKLHVEPGRRLDASYHEVPIDIQFAYGEDGTEQEYERVIPAEYEVPVSELRVFREFCERTSALLSAMAPSLRTGQSESKTAARFRRSVQHFLLAGEDAFSDGEVWGEDSADATLHYVVALEAVLAGTDSGNESLSRKVSQRAAVLAGVDDGDRLRIAKLVKHAYRARSQYAHGSDPAEVDLPELREVTRRCLLGLLVLNDRLGTDAVDRLDEALLDHRLLEEVVRLPIAEFRTDVGVLPPHWPRRRRATR